MTDSQPIQKFVETNAAHWNELSELHAASDFYDVEGFLAGETSLNNLEREELGDVEGKQLLHLQCHFGLDTLSWAREGADVTGVDISETAINLATTLADQIGIDATFVAKDILNLEGTFDTHFDIVFTSYGVINWLPELTTWATVIEENLSEGGTFYMAELHPTASMLTPVSEAVWKPAHPYFPRDSPVTINEAGTYTTDDDVTNNQIHLWPHSLGEVISSLTEVGLEIEFLHEFPWCVTNLQYGMFEGFPDMEQDSEGRWWLPDEREVPLMFSIKTHKPES